MRFGSYLKNGRPIWHDKISPLKPPISPFETLKKPLWCSKKLGSMLMSLPIDFLGAAMFKTKSKMGTPLYRMMRLDKVTESA